MVACFLSARPVQALCPGRDPGRATSNQPLPADSAIQHHHPAQNSGQAEASTDPEIATSDHHPHDPAFSQGLAGSVSLPQAP